MLMHYCLAFAVTSVTHLILAIIVFTHGPRRLTNVTYAFYSIAIAFWSGFELLAVSAPTTSAAVFFWRVNHIGVTFIPIFFVHFVYSLLESSERIRRTPLISLSYVVGLAFIALDATPLLVADAVPKFSFRHFLHPGPLYSVYFFSWIAWALHGLIELFRFYFKSSGSRRNQLTYFCWPMLIAYLGGVPNFLPTFNIEIPYLMPFGTYAIPVYGLATVYAILRHKLLDIRVAITRTGLLLATYLFVLGTPFLVGWWGRMWLEAWLGREWWLVPLGLCTALATAGPFAYAYLWRQAEKKLLKDQRRYQRTLQMAARGMTRVRDLPRLATLITRVVSHSVRITHASLFLWDKTHERYVLHASFGPKRLAVQSRYVLEPSHPLIGWFRTHQRVLSEEDAAVPVHGPIRQELITLGASVIVPGFIEKDLIGFLVLGPKRSGQGYAADDVHAFATLANEAAIAIENASSYEELLRVNEQLKAASERLLQQERLAAAGQFAVGMAHEVKNPLSAIKTFAQYLPEKYQDPMFRQKFFRIVQDEIDRINTIVKELSDFAKPAPLELQPIHLSELIDDTLSLLSNQCLKQGVEVCKSFGENGTVVQADPQQLKQVILNLFLNSLDAMPNGGRLEVATALTGSTLTLSIQDTGCGIPTEHLRHIWDPFFTTKERGMGLGLAIVRGVVERHGGQIAISNAPRQGTVAEVHLPLPDGLSRTLKKS